MKLSVDQEAALGAYLKGNNVFLTGPGGSGKTELIKQMVECAGESLGKNVQVCALTGCAAVLLNCGAKTVHSWAGIGLAAGPSGRVVERVCKNRYKRVAWMKTDVLIIDEVSMMSKKLFEILDQIGRRVRRCPMLPFGGIQLVFSGDFYQLPPVGDNDDPDTSAFCFESPNWPKTFDVTIQLTTIFRQTDKNYTKVLNQIRVGKLSKSAYERLRERVGQTATDSLIKPTILLPRRYDVNLINVGELRRLEGEVKEYKLSPADDLPLTDKDRLVLANISTEQRDIELKFLMNNVMADRTLELKIGAQVMCVANIDMEGPSPIVNGSQGVVVEFLKDLPVVQFNCGHKRIMGHHVWSSETIPGVGVKQIPLIHAWAITIHKAQGVTLELAEIDAGSNIFECGQTYVALSRVKSLDGLYLTALNPQKIRVSRKVKEFYAALVVQLLECQSE